ncbi:outer membrane usher protein [Erwinia amylovora]
MRIRTLSYCILLAMLPGLVIAGDDDMQFNTDVLDVKDRANIDLGQFSRAGYVMPGTYTMTVHVNKASLPEESVTFLTPDDDPKGSEACLSPSLVDHLGFKENLQKQFTWWHHGGCLNTQNDALKGMTVRGDLASSSLYLSIPQAYLEFTSDTWDPPSRWDDGIPGIMADYYAGIQRTQAQGNRSSGYSASGNGTVGANAGAWRLRADWQASRTQSGQTSNQQVQWSRYYLYRAIRSLRAKLVIGEDYLTSDLFDSPRFMGARLVSDDSQLPPNLRGYAPEITGVARTNAKVTVSQQGRVLYESQVAPGPFQIQTLNDATSGTLDVTVQEQDGSVQKFQVNTASVPYLTRPGLVRYKLAAGRPDDIRHRVNGPMFATGEFSWGVDNGWSLYGGGMFGGNYNALSVGIGRDLLALGAMSFDVSSSRAELSRQGNMSGNSFRLSYSKTFDSLDSQVTFAGYRFSERSYMSLSEYLDAREAGEKTGGSKQMYTVSFNKQFRSIGLSSYFNISRQTFWDDRPANIRYSLALAKYFDIGKLKNLNLSLSVFRNQLLNAWDKGGFLSLSVPFGSDGSVSYSTNVNNGVTQNRVGYAGRLNDRDSYQISAGGGQGGIGGGGAFSHSGEFADITASADYQAGQYASAGLSARGGMTATLEGAALHRVTQYGGTRLMIGADGVSGLPVHGFGNTVETNLTGVAVISDVNSYYRNEASIDLARLPEDIDVPGAASVREATLTEGAIGFRRFDVLTGKKAMVTVGLNGGGSPPFGAIVLNKKGQQTGMVGDDGNTWLSGMNPGEKMDVNWNGRAQCTMTLPQRLDASALLLPCILNRESPADAQQDKAQKSGDDK